MSKRNCFSNIRIVFEKIISETPVYAEDFSDNSKGWYINTEESYGYTANVSTEGKYDLDIDTKQLGADFPDSPILSDFVLQFDFVALQELWWKNKLGYQNIDL